METATRVLIVDDSQLIREILVAMLQDAPGLQVLGQARDGEEAVRLAARLRPDVITMDIRMPRMNGLEATRQIMSKTPTPIVVLASSIYDTDMNIAFNAIAAGALTVVEKPKGLSLENFEVVRDQLVTTLKLMSEVKVVTLFPSKRRGDKETKKQSNLQSPISNIQSPISNIQSPISNLQSSTELIVIAASTGGPGTLNRILHTLPADFSIPIVLVQHITPGFGQGFANWLNSTTALEVAIAEEGVQVAPGKVLVAAEARHMTLAANGMIRLNQSEPVKGQRPSATPLFESAAKAYGSAALGVILSGMGDDGVDGLETLWQAGGRVIAQDEDSCAVFGMPKVAIERGIVDEILTPDEIASTLVRLNGHRKWEM